MTTTGTVRAVFFAALREQAGCDGVECPEAAGLTPRELYGRLAAQYGFTLAPGAVRFAVGDAYVCGDAPLAPGDEILFIPPVAGG